MSINPNINPNDLVNRLTQKGAKQVASTFGAMSQKTSDQQKVEKQSYDINKQYEIIDKNQQAKELEKNSKDAGLVSQSLTNKELDEDAVMFDEQLLIEEGAREQGLLTKQENVVEDESELEINQVNSSLTAKASLTSVKDKSSNLFAQIASKVGATPEQIETAAKEEVENQLNTNKSEMTQLKFPSETAFIETEIYKESNPATSEIKENKLILMDNSPLDVEIAEKEFGL